MITKRIVTEEAGGDSSSSSGSSTVKDKFAQGVKLVQEAVTKRRLECEEEIRREEMERDKKITSENIYKEVYDKTVKKGGGGGGRDESNLAHYSSHTPSPLVVCGPRKEEGDSY